MRFNARVRVEQGDASGSLVASHAPKEVVVEFGSSSTGAPVLTLHLKPRPLALPCAPPLVLYGGGARQGRMGLRFLRVKLDPWSSTTRCIQVSLTTADTDALVTLRDKLNACLSCGSKPGPGPRGHAGKPGRPCTQRHPLTPRSLNSSACAVPFQSLATSCFSDASLGRRGGSSGATPASSGISSAAAATQGRASSTESVQLSSEQQHAVDLVRAGKNVFFTGCAGTGKSRLLAAILAFLPPATTFVTASTGLAACALGGTTIHSFAGVGLGGGSLETLAARAGRGESAARWRRVTTLIIDEARCDFGSFSVSMLDAALFTQLESLACRIRGSQAPFGGIQLILSGDFHQLPPVTKGGAARAFCFQSPVWSRCVDASVLLSRVYRQAGDDGFIALLGRVREGSSGPTEMQDLQRRCAAPLACETSGSGVLATRLFTHRADVDAVNAAELARLPGPGRHFPARDEGAVEALAGACPARASLELRVGAQVLLLRTLSAREGLVNGARGVVTGFAPGRGLPIVAWAAGPLRTLAYERWALAAGGRTLAAREALPLDLGWALSVHRCQGMSLDAAEVDLARAFEPGMAYVALSRVRNVQGLRILPGGIAPAALRADPAVLAFYGALETQQHGARAGGEDECDSSPQPARAAQRLLPR